MRSIAGDTLEAFLAVALHHRGSGIPDGAGMAARVRAGWDAGLVSPITQIVCVVASIAISFALGGLCALILAEWKRKQKRNAKGQFTKGE